MRINWKPYRAANSNVGAAAVGGSEYINIGAFVGVVVVPPAPPPPPPPPPPGVGGGAEGSGFRGAAGHGHYAAFPVGDSRPKPKLETDVSNVTQPPAKDELTPFMIEMARQDAIREELALRKANALMQKKLDILEDDEDFMALIMSMPFN